MANDETRGDAPTSSSSIGGEVAYHLLRWGSVVAPRVPHRVGHALANLVGAAAWANAGDRRRRALANTARVLALSPDDPDTRQVVRRQFAHQAASYYDALRMPAITDARLRAITEFVGWRHFLAAEARGKGVILVTGHIGSMEYVAHIARAFGVRFTVPAEQVRPPKLFNLLTALRGAHGTRIISVEGPEVVGLYRVLRRNETIGLPIDRYTGLDAVQTPFFGHAAGFPAGPAMLARRTGAALVPAYTLRVGVDRYRVTFEPAIEVSRIGDPSTAAADAMRQVVARLAVWIRRHPAQWASFNRMWDDIP